MSNVFQKNDIVALHNVSDEDFVFEYNKAEGNLPYEIPAGEVRRYPGWLAEHGLKHLIDKILTSRQERINNVTKRQELANEIVVSIESLSRKREPSESDLLKEKIKELNQPSDLELLLNEREVDKSEQKEKAKPKKKSKKDAKKKVKKTKPKKKKRSKSAPRPTKAELILYAQNELKMNMDKRTLKKLRGMKVDDLIDELDYPMD